MMIMILWCFWRCFLIADLLDHWDQLTDGNLQFVNSFGGGVFLVQSFCSWVSCFSFVNSRLFLLRNSTFVNFFFSGTIWTLGIIYSGTILIIEIIFLVLLRE